MLRKLLRQYAGKRIDGASGGIGNDNAHGLDRVLRERDLLGESDE
jgi:hypothetical protein